MRDAVPVVLCVGAVALGAVAVRSPQRRRAWCSLGASVGLLGVVAMLTLSGVLGALWVVLGLGLVIASRLGRTERVARGTASAGLSAPAALLAATVALALMGVVLAERGSSAPVLGPGEPDMLRLLMSRYGPASLAIGLAYLAVAIRTSMPGGRR